MSTDSALSLLVPVDDVVGEGLENIQVFIDHPQDSVAPIAQKVSDGPRRVAVVNAEPVVILANRVRSLFADFANTFLEKDFCVVLFGSKPVIPFESMFSGVTRGLIPLSGMPLPVLSLLKSQINKARPSSRFSLVRFWGNINSLKTSQTVSSSDPLINLKDSMFGIDFPSATPTGLTTGVLLDGYLPTEGTTSTAVADVDSSQRVEVRPLALGMPFDVSDGLTFDPATIPVVSGGNRCLPSTSTVAQTKPNVALRIAA